MILRLPQKRNTKIKAGRLAETPPDENPYSGWSYHLSPRIALSTSSSPTLRRFIARDAGSGNHGRQHVHRTSSGPIREFTADDGKRFIYRKSIAPSSGMVSFGLALNCSVTESMNDHLHAAKFMLEDDMAPSDIDYRWKETPVSALEGPIVANAAIPKACFRISWIGWATSDVEADNRWRGAVGILAL